jgi:methylthioribose-1-phosphate isomerase|tara:strand:- start:746 stop:1822 length:1077 start_codon:yes stop_codon:yes gene_type:complete
MLVGKEHLTTIWFDDKKLSIQIIDQRFLPHDLKIVTLHTLEEAEYAIREMQVRGAPLIGVTAAFGMYLASLRDSSTENLNKSGLFLKKARPTAVNLSWAVNKILEQINEVDLIDRQSFILNLAIKIREDDILACSNIGNHGSLLIEELYKKKQSTINILTHCNAGWLAAVDWGTALAPIFKANKKNIPIHVWVDETRPRNQGFNLTAWELINEKIPCSLIVDNVGGHLMQKGLVDVCITGTDRTTKSGDVCNKIGTYLKALAAYDNKIPFYVAAPISSIDYTISDGLSDIPIEERDPKEVTTISGLNSKQKLETISIVPKNAQAVNYAFDVTPSKFITKIITEKGSINANKKSIVGLV